MRNKSIKITANDLSNAENYKPNFKENEKEWFDFIHKKSATYSLSKSYSHTSQKYGEKTRIKPIAAFTFKKNLEREIMCDILARNEISYTLSEAKRENGSKYIYINSMKSIYKLINISGEKNNERVNAMREYILNRKDASKVDECLKYFNKYKNNVR